MTFGNMGETFELVAIKSSGVSLLRFMRPIMWVAIFLCGVTFMFANYVIPYANLKFATLYSDIYVKKPAFDLKEGVFFTYIPNYAIKVGKKDDDGKTIRNVIIYEQNNVLQDNCIIAEKGVMKISDDEKYLEFNLENGCRYQEKGNFMDTATEFTRLSFKNFKKLFDLSVLQKQQTNDSVFRNNYKMLSARQLSKNIDSLKIEKEEISQRFLKQVNYSFKHTKIPEQEWKKYDHQKSATNVNIIVPDSIMPLIDNLSMSIVNETKANLQQTINERKLKNEDINFHLIEWHRKYSLSLACLILFFIGAPLGAIIKKGGLGMPLVTAIVFFLMFHLLNMFGEKFSKQMILAPSIGMWLAIIGLAPIGAFLTYKAMHDSQLFNKDAYIRFFSSFKKVLKLKS